MDFDPRDFDSRDEERFSVDRDRGCVLNPVVWSRR